jgi:DNA-binding response OmpR family regulator
VTVPRILLAESDRATRALLVPVLNGLAGEIIEAKDGDGLERALVSGPRYHLVIASARLPEPSALQVLARVRRHGITTPFIVVTSLHGQMLRVFMSETDGTVLSSRMLDAENLVSAVSDMIARYG